MDLCLGVLLSVKNLTTHFHTYRGVVKAIDDLSFDVDDKEVLGLVGETGSGKSVTALSILRLISKPGRIEKGEVIFQGTDLLKLDEKEMRKIRGAKIATIFQDPSSSLNPVLTIGYQVAEAIKTHQDVNGKESLKRAVDSLTKVQIPSASRRVKEYPHEFSGGMKQRVMIAMALSCHPTLLIADEPTTSLDVTIQAQILNLIKELKDDEGISVLLITHDLGIVAHMCDRVGIMYAGKMVEMAPVKDLFLKPRHPYTIGLLQAVLPTRSKKNSVTPIPGSVPDMISPPEGCRFHPRCAFAREICHNSEPQLDEKEKGHWAACHFDKEVVFSYQT